MKKLFLTLAFTGMVGAISASTVSTLVNPTILSIVIGDDKKGDDKKKDKKDCADKKACTKEGKSCCKKGEKKEAK